MKETIEEHVIIASNRSQAAGQDIKIHHSRGVSREGCIFQFRCFLENFGNAHMGQFLQDGENACFVSFLDALASLGSVMTVRGSPIFGEISDQWISNLKYKL